MQRTEGGVRVRELTRKELESVDGAKPTKPLAEGGVPDEGK
ncbi:MULTISPECIES: hypothetical protein [Streptomyces]|uniref:Uncharacterized protein n=2 Tax=Streptomyces TaxID=1883 RepID=A0ABU2RK73_9ACTN|nr:MULTISPECIES: hypothetical protein [unclassified Streptomyces]MDT0427933.1 hypothetical protein [Streptomyces sp. DSM 41770]